MIETLVVLALAGCVPDGAELLCRFPAPQKLASRHVRLEVACAHAVYLNGLTVAGPAPVRTVTDLLSGRGGNTLRLHPACNPAKLLITPRVFIASVRRDAGGLSVTVENTLDNTVSVAVSCRGPAGAAAASATIPANALADLLIAVRGEGTVTCVLDKTSEAVEGAYQFALETIFQ